MVAKTMPFRHNPTMLLRKGTKMTEFEIIATAIVVEMVLAAKGYILSKIKKEPL